jgi:hypothetical protein
MSPSQVIDGPSFKLSPIDKEEGKKTNFGAIVTGLDLNDISGKF